eukprot:7183093-Ditylum_brightwellii.AAC.1
MLCQNYGKRKCGDNNLIVGPKDRPNLRFQTPKGQNTKKETTMMSSMTSNSNNTHITKKRGRDNTSSSLTASQAKKKVTKFCLLYDRGNYTTNKCNVIKDNAKHIKGKNDNRSHFHQNNSGKHRQHCSKEELNVIIGKSIKAALKRNATTPVAMLKKCMSLTSSAPYPFLPATVQMTTLIVLMMM